MITTNVIRRVFHIQIGPSIGTAFAIDHLSKQYLVTARHLVEAQSDEVKISILHDGLWKRLTTTLVGSAEGEVDITVLAPNLQLAPMHPLIPSLKDIILAQQVFFLGFPHGMTGENKEFNRDFPLPLIKAGILSGISDQGQKIWIDGHNNKGFSGGPVVFTPGNQQVNKNVEYQVAGVISGYTGLENPVYDADNNRIGFASENLGIVLAYNIKYAVELIEANPIGFEARE